MTPCRTTRSGCWPGTDWATCPPAASSSSATRDTVRQTVWVFIQRHRETERLALYRDTLRHTVGFLYRDTMRQTVGFYTETRWDRPLGFCIQTHRETDRRVFIQRHGETHCWVFIQLYRDTVRRAVGFYTDGEAHRWVFFLYTETP